MQKAIKNFYINELASLASNSPKIYIISLFTIYVQARTITFKEQPDKKEDLAQLLHPLVKQWFFAKFQDFALAQQYAILEVHARQNILISAPTGSGKTLTAFLSILNELVDSAEKGILQNKVYVVYVSPLKALGRDIHMNLTEPLQEIEALAGKKLGIRVAVRTGDTTAYEKQKMLLHPPHILVTTPESLAIMLSSLKFRNYLQKVDWCVVDEIHALADNKRGVHMNVSLERLQYLSPGMCRVGLSATVSPLEEIAQWLVGPLRKCKVVDVQFIKQLDLQVLSPVPDLVNVPFHELQRKQYELIDQLIHEHKTTLIFTNTRSGTERVVHHLRTKFPKKYTQLFEDQPEKTTSLIGAHHGSLSKEHRFALEDALRNGKLKAVVCSTSLELGIDIGYIDLVICLGSPKSVARFLQRCGRAGHQLHSTVKGRLIVMDRDDLVECALLLKNAKEKKIDRVHLPTKCLDVLAQQIYGFALEQVWEEKELYRVITQSYCYKDLSHADYEEILKYLAGEFVTLEDRYIYAKIWRNEGKIGKKGMLGRVIYMTNLGTIPDESYITVKMGEQVIGHIDEGFLERLKRGDIFVLGGDVYEFLFARGMVAQVRSAVGRKPTIPSWFSEMLPLSFDLATDIQKFRKLMEEKFRLKKSKSEILAFLSEYLYVDKNAAEAIYWYCKEQFDFIGMPHLNKLLIEHFTDEKNSTYVVFHSLFGRRVNDVLSRAVAFAIGRTQHRDVEVGITDNGFFIRAAKKVQVTSVMKMLKASELRQVMSLAIDKSEILRRRFRHCATRSFMILRTYKGQTKRVGKQQVSSMILMNAVRRISDDFCILREARREVLEDLMDVENTTLVIKALEEEKLKVEEVHTQIPSPFAFNLILQGYSDILKIEDRHEFLQRMHKMVLAKMGTKKTGKNVPEGYDELWEKMSEEKGEARE